MLHKIAISIINFRTAELTIQCVGSVLRDMDGIDAKIVIVDNHSADGSVETLGNWIEAQNDQRIMLVCSPMNRGFSSGHNQGLSACEAELYLVLNSDAILRPGFLKSIISAADAAPDAGLIAPLLSYEDGSLQTSCFRFHTPFSELIRSARTGFITRILKKYDVSLGSDPAPADIQWASFACILLRAKMTKEIGPMDEGYFLYFEDAEYCLRAKRAGWSIRQDRQATAIHHRGGSGPVKALTKSGKRLPAYFYSSRSRFLYQAHGRIGVLTANLCWHAGRGLATLRYLIGKPTAPMNEFEHRDIWINAFNPLGPPDALDNPE